MIGFVDLFTSRDYAEEIHGYRYAKEKGGCMRIGGGRGAEQVSVYDLDRGEERGHGLVAQ